MLVGPQLSAMIKKRDIWIAGSFTVIGALFGAIATVLTPFSQHYLERRLKSGSVSISVNGVQEQITVSLDSSEKRILNPKTNFVRFENVQPGVHMIEYATSAGLNRAEKIRVDGSEHHFFELPAIDDPKKATVSTLVPQKLALTGTIKAAVPLASLASLPGCCWVFLGSYRVTVRGVEMSSDATIATEGTYPSKGHYYLTKLDLIVRDKPFAIANENASPKQLGILKAGSVIQIDEIQPTGFFGLTPTWGKVHVY